MAMSSSDFLSQDEVDALLKGVTGEIDQPEDDDGAEGGVRPYNLATQERISHGRMPTMELINGRFAHYLRSGLSNFMHRSTEVSAGPIRVQKYGELLRNLIAPSNLNLVRAKPLPGTGLVVFDPNLVYLVVDSMFGGNGRVHSCIEGRELTPTEQRIIRGMLGVVFAEYSHAWEPVFRIELEYLRSEVNARFANIATPSEVVVSTSFSVAFGGSQAEMHVCFPHSMMAPISDVLSSPMPSDHPDPDSRWLTHFTRQVQTAEVEIACNLGSARVTLRDVANMQVGDVIPLHFPELIQAEVDHVPVMELSYGTRGGRYAVRGERFLSAKDEAPL